MSGTGVNSNSPSGTSYESQGSYEEYLAREQARAQALTTQSALGAHGTSVELQHLAKPLSAASQSPSSVASTSVTSPVRTETVRAASEQASDMKKVETFLMGTLIERIGAHANENKLPLETEADFFAVLGKMKDDPNIYKEINAEIEAQMDPGVIQRMKTYFGGKGTELANTEYFSKQKLGAAAIAGGWGALTAHGWLYPIWTVFDEKPSLRNGLITGSLYYALLTKPVADVAGKTLEAGGRTAAGVVLGLPHFLAKFIVDSLNDGVSGMPEAIKYNFNELLEGGTQIIDFIFKNPKGLDQIPEILKGPISQIYESMHVSAPDDLKPIFKYFIARINGENNAPIPEKQELIDAITFLEQVEKSDVLFSENDMIRFPYEIRTGVRTEVSAREMQQFNLTYMRNNIRMHLSKMDEMGEFKTEWKKIESRVGLTPDEQTYMLNRAQQKLTLEDVYPNQDKGTSAFNTLTGTIGYGYVFLTILYNMILGGTAAVKGIRSKWKEKAELKTKPLMDRPPKYSGIGWPKLWNPRLTQTGAADRDLKKIVAGGTLAGLTSWAIATQTIRASGDQIFEGFSKADKTDIKKIMEQDVSKIEEAEFKKALTALRGLAHQDGASRNEIAKAYQNLLKLAPGLSDPAKKSLDDNFKKLNKLGESYSSLEQFFHNRKTIGSATFTVGMENKKGIIENRKFEFFQSTNGTMKTLKQINPINLYDKLKSGIPIKVKEVLDGGKTNNVKIHFKLQRDGSIGFTTSRLPVRLATGYKTIDELKVEMG